MSPRQLLAKSVQFATTNKKILLYVIGGIAAAGIVGGVVLYTSGGLLKGSLPGPLVINPVVFAPSIQSCATDPASPTAGSSMKYVLTVSNMNSTNYSTTWLWSGGPTINTIADTSLDLTYPTAGSYSVTAQIKKKSDNSIVDSTTCNATVKAFQIPIIIPQLSKPSFGACTITPSSPRTSDTVNTKVAISNFSSDSKYTYIWTCVGAETCNGDIGSGFVETNSTYDAQGSYITKFRLLENNVEIDTASCTANVAKVLTINPNSTPCVSFTYSDWGGCTNNSQSRTVTATTPAICTGGVLPVLTQSCTSASTACSSFTYSAWGNCANNSQSRTVTASTPANCSGGATPVLSRSCTSAPASSQTQPSISTPEEVPTACTGEDILTCSAMSDQLVLSDKIPLRVNCSLNKSGYVTSEVIKGTVSDPNQPQSESSIMKKLLDNKSYTASKSQPKGFYVLFDGLNTFDAQVDEGDYSILTTARLTPNTAPDCSVQKFKVVKEAAQTTQETATGTGTTQETGLTEAQAGKTTEPETPAAPSEPSKCPGVNYPTDIKGHWAESLIKQAYDLCMLKGYSDGTFGPDRPITRAEAVKTALSAAGIKPVLGCYDPDCGSPYTDLEMWQGQWLRAAWNLQIIKSEAHFRPNDSITRAEAAVIVANAFIKSGKIKISLHADCFTANCGAGFPDNFFTDIKDRWQGPPVRWLWDAGLTQGRAPGMFEPNIPITRAELAKLVMLAAEKE
jgi:hypothetical protein